MSPLNSIFRWPWRQAWISLLLAWLPAAGAPAADPEKPIGTSHPPKASARIFSSCSSATEILVRIGAVDALAAIDDYGRSISGAEAKPSVGRGPLSVERLLVLKPDLAFVWWYQESSAATLEKIGVPVVRIDCGRAADVPKLIRQVAKAAGRETAGEPLARDLEKVLDRPPPASSSTKPLVYLELYAPGKTGGHRTYVQDLIEMSGGINAASGMNGFGLLSSEVVVRSDPDVILLAGSATTAAELSRRPGWSKLKAIRLGRVYTLPAGALSPGPSLPETRRRMEEILYPHKPGP